MPRYPVLSPILHDGAPFAPGDDITLGEAEAAVLQGARALGEALPEPLADDTPPESAARRGRKAKPSPSAP